MKLANLLAKTRAQRATLEAEAEQLFSAGVTGYQRSKNDRERREVGERIARLEQQMDDESVLVRESEIRVRAAQTPSSPLARVVRLKSQRSRPIVRLGAAGQYAERIARFAAPGHVERAYAVIQSRSIERGKDSVRIIGVATTPTPDRYGDIVEPLGAQYKLPLPLLWQHHAAEPVGNVTAAKVKQSAISFTAEIPLGTRGTVGERIEEALQSIEHGLVRGVSIGFRPLLNGVERQEDGSFRFRKWEWLELSLVTIPANAEATIAP